MPPLPYVYLVIAILVEVIATSALKASGGFTKPGPSLVVIAGYSLSFFLLSLTLRTIPVGVAYAIWAGVGITAITAVGWFVFKQVLDVPALVGISMIMAGVAVINLFSKTAGH
jgi:small multidrug resistance pump